LTGITPATLKIDVRAGAVYRGGWDRMAMNIGKFRVSRRSATILAVMVGSVSLAIGAHAALYKRTPDSSQAASIAPVAETATDGSKLALVIGNGRYPDADAPLVQPVEDARALAARLHRDGFDVDEREDAGKADMAQAVERLKSKIRRNSVVLLFFAGFGVQSRGQNYLIPVDAAIWDEGDVRRDGLSIKSVMAMIEQRGARARLVIVDASRRNPYERRFRSYSHGLAPIDAQKDALVLSSADPNQVIDDGQGRNSRLVSALLANMDSPTSDAVTIFSRTREAVSQTTKGRQVPFVSSSLADDVHFQRDVQAAADQPKN
jgi:uncharacterized caspase-like protein